MSERPRILIVEDDAGTSAMLAELFRAHGLAVTTLDSALGVIDVAKRVRPHVVLMDVALPYRSGASLLGSLKANPDTQDVPVVICSDIVDTLTPTRRAMAAAVLEKPIDTQRLLATVQDLVPSSPLPAHTSPSVAPRRATRLTSATPSRTPARRTAADSPA